MNLARVLAECAELERRIAGFYRQFALTWPSDAELVALWNQLADEEETHARALESLRARLAGPPRRKVVDREALAQLRGYVLGAGRIVGPVSVDEAFRICLDLESLELHEVYRRLTEAAREDPAVPEEALRECLEALRGHDAPLAETIARRSDRPDLRERASRIAAVP